jgi:hypothetical protein
MKRLARILVGYRDDLDLSGFWWHRLYRVLAAVSIVAVLLWRDDVNYKSMTVIGPDTLNADGTIKDFGHVVEVHPGEAGIEALIEVTVFWIVLANAYYRGVVYVVKGPRRLVPKDRSA